MLGGMVGVGILFPMKFFGSVDVMFETLERIRPDHLSLPDSAGLGISWYTSTALLCGLAMWIWPHGFTASYAAKSERVVRRNAGILPLYQLALVPVIVVGFTCAAKAGLDPAFAAKIDKPDHAMLVALVGHFPPWLAGLVGAGALAASISTASALILTASNLVARNVIQKAAGLDDRQAAWAGRILVPVVTAAALVFVFLAPGMLVSLLLTGFSGIGQFLPAVLLGLFARWPTSKGIFAGIAAGLCVVVACHLAGWPLPLGVHPGFLGLLVNTLVVVVASRMTRAVEPGRLERFERLLSEKL
jgi:SSS family solute:Na+ symporter